VTYFGVRIDYFINVLKFVLYNQII